MTEYKQRSTTEIVNSDPIEDFVREYNSRVDFKRILEDYDRRIINETDPIKKQELITLKTAFLWENECMYRIYKGIHNIDEEYLKEAVSNLTEKDIKDAIDNVFYDSKSKEDNGLLDKINSLLNV